MTGDWTPLRFWLWWVAANALGELIGLGAVASAGFAIIAIWGQPVSEAVILGFAAVMVMCGMFEGFVLGQAQRAVLEKALPDLKSWVRATMWGAAMAWALGMAPSTAIDLMEAGGNATAVAPSAAPEIPHKIQWMLAIGLGLVAGPILAIFQWRILRRHVAHAARWLPANAIAWAVGMPIIMWGADTAAQGGGAFRVIVTIASTLFVAGAAVGAIQGSFLVWLIEQKRPR